MPIFNNNIFINACIACHILRRTNTTGIVVHFFDKHMKLDWLCELLVSVHGVCFNIFCFENSVVHSTSSVLIVL